MTNYRGTRSKVQKMTAVAILMAIVVVVQVICTFIKFGPFSITLALAPIIIGAAIYGVGTGAFLGAVFGVVVLVTGVLGWDGGTVMLLMGINPYATVALCIVKGLAAGFAAGAVYALIERKNSTAAVITSGIVCPIVNTGLFIAGMLVFFNATISGWAADEGMNLFGYIIFGLTGVNFLVEVGANMILSGGITRIIQIVKR